jgi:hypothetical protein
MAIAVPEVGVVFQVVLQPGTAALNELVESGSFGVPEFDGLVFTAGNNYFAIGAKTEAGD